MLNTLSLASSLRLPFTVGLFAAVLSGCGGGSGPATVAGTDIPVSATTDTAQLISFGSGVIAGSSESSEPLAVGDVNLATSETDEPDASV